MTRYIAWMLTLLAALCLPRQSMAQGSDDMRSRAIRVGVMLPLNDYGYDGRRMVEYYRGVLMACDSLRQHGVSVDVRAWNVAETTDISTVLREQGAADRDLIIGPYYGKQMAQIAQFADDNGIDVLVPFNVRGADACKSDRVFQAYLSPADFNSGAIEIYREMFSNYHTVFIDCNDSTSRKGPFTMGLRTRLDQLGRSYRITNLKSDEDAFTKAFSTTQPNMVVVNTGRGQELSVVFARLNNLTMNNEGIQVSMYGYPEWVDYTQYNLDNYYKFNVYVPSASYYNPLSSKTARFEQKYRWNFHADMEATRPRMALAGFDHTYFFVRGLSLMGERFEGLAPSVGYTAIQTPLDFEKQEEGGYKNRAMMTIHYTPTHKIETTTY